MMLNRSKTALAAAVAAAGTVCVLGAASAAAATPGAWSGRTGPVPHAFTNATPAMTSVTFPGHAALDTLVAWRGQRGARIFYAYTRSPNLSGGWSARAFIPGASSSAGPSIASYIDPLGHVAVLATWKGLGNSRIFYAQGETRHDGTIAWTAPHILPGPVFGTTSRAPAVMFPADAVHDRAIVAWKGPFQHVRVSVGTPHGRRFTWSPSHKLSAAEATRTGAAPGLAEVQTGTAKGTLYVFWKGLHSTQVRYATASDPLKISATGLDWSAAAVVPGARTTAGPAASALGSHRFGPLMLTYKGIGLQVRFQTLTAGVWSAQAAVPGALTAVGPAQLRGVLATTSPDISGSIFFRIFS